MIIRDPFNWLASRLKKNYLTVRNKNLTPINLWISYAKEYLGESQILKNNKTCINYNQWFEDRDYRQQIAAQLGLEFSDRGINKVHGCGGGSSFDGREFDKKATEMDVLNRWRLFAEDPRYRKLLDNEELLEYSERIFGHIPGTEIIRTK